MTGKGILKYLAYVFIGGWMFLLGIMVGRGTAPISFDTSGLNERLAGLVKEKSEGHSSKLELGFYDALEKPNDPEVIEVTIKPKKSNLLEKQKMDISLISDKETNANAGSYEKIDKKKYSSSDPNFISENIDIPKKTARKSDTLNRSALNQFMAGSSTSNNEDPSRPITNKRDVVKKSSETFSKPLVPNRKKSTFTIQLASFKDEKDAMTYISQLKAKGVSAGVVKKIIDGKSWHRVRLGIFSNHDQAKERLSHLKKRQIDGFIIKVKDAKK